jgi:hypothetical protein
MVKNRRSEKSPHHKMVPSAKQTKEKWHREGTTCKEKKNGTVKGRVYMLSIAGAI